MASRSFTGRVFLFSSRRRHTRFDCDWSSDVCSSDLFQNQEVQSSLEQVSRAFLLILHGGSLPLSIRRLGEGNVSAWRPPRCGRHGGGVSPAPIESETLAVPGDDGFGLEDEQCRPPIVSPPGEPNPEDAIGPGEARLVATALARKGDTSLLCKCNDFNTYGSFGRDR